MDVHLHAVAPLYSREEFENMQIRTLHSKDFEGDWLYQSCFSIYTEITQEDSFLHTNKLQLKPATRLPVYSPSPIQLSPMVSTQLNTPLEEI